MLAPNGLGKFSEEIVQFVITRVKPSFMWSNPLQLSVVFKCLKALKGLVRFLLPAALELQTSMFALHPVTYFQNFADLNLWKVYEKKE